MPDTVNGTGNRAYSSAVSVPSDARSFERWFMANRDDMDEEFGKKAARAYLALLAMEAGAAHQAGVMDAANRRDLQAFVDAYTAYSVSAKGNT